VIVPNRLDCRIANSQSSRVIVAVSFDTARGPMLREARRGQSVNYMSYP
jgi:hypothetical protein